MSDGRRRILAVASLYLVAFLAVSLMGCADRLLLHPTRGSIAPPLGARGSIPFDGGELDVIRWRSSAGTPRARVIAFTGNGGRAEYELPAVAVLFEREPVEIVAVNLPGYGRSSGEARLSSLVPAALATYDALQSESPSLPTLVYGNSMGGAVALGLAAERPVIAVVLRNVPPLRRLILVRHGWWNLWLLALPVAFSVPSRLDAVATAPAVSAPALILRATRDEIVPPDYQQAVDRVYGGSLTLVEYDGGHNDPLDSRAIESARVAIASLLR